MRIVVTGGAGFIGSNLVRELTSEGHDLVVIDNLHTGTPGNLSGLGKVKVIKADSGSINELEMPEAEVIFHFGMPSSSPMYAADRNLSGRTAEEFRIILEYAMLHDSRVVFASTSSLYGRCRPPHSEDMDVVPMEGYTQSRFSMERLAREYHEKHDVSAVGLRLFSVYGPNEKAKGKYANVLSQFLWSMQKGERPIVYGDGTQTRDFVFVKDVVRAFMLAMDSSIRTGVFNVGTGKATTMNAVVQAINTAIGNDIEPLHVGNPVRNYVMHTQADCSRSMEVLGFEAEYTLERGIEKILSETRH